MKLELHEHISRLLYDHECVIIPGLGAFLTRYHAAEVNHATHMMRPPSRRVYFNSSIRENDGLLAKSVSYLEQINYQDALDQITRSVKEWQVILNDGKKVNLAGIGRLYKDDASRLQFNPSLEINYSPASYGLAIFRSPAIQRQAEIRKTINKAIEKHVINEHPETNTKKVAGWVSWAAVLGPVILASAIGYAYFTTAPQPLENMSGFSIMNFSRSIRETPEPPMSYEAEEPASEVEEIAETRPAENAASAITEDEPAKEPVDYNTPAKTGHYHIVVGSFKDAHNANTYITQLKSQGYNAYLAEGDNSYSRVAIGNFASEASARNALDGIKQNVHPNSWIYAN